MNVAIITGASSGMGNEFVKQLETYYTVDEIYVIARRKERLEELQKEVKAKVRVLPLDLTDMNSFKIYEDFLKENNPNVTLLVNAAGFGMFDEYCSCSFNVNNSMVDLNCRSLQAITYLTIPYMKKNSQIVQLSSMSSIQPVPYITLYGATKAFVLSFSRALNVELKHKGIKVLALLPFWVSTEFFEVSNKKNMIKYFDVIYTPNFIVRKCYQTLIKKKHKDILIPGKYAKLQFCLVKLLPHSLIMKIWLKKEKIK